MKIYTKQINVMCTKMIKSKSTLISVKIIDFASYYTIIIMQSQIEKKC
jgi:hypothetical protein